MIILDYIRDFVQECTECYYYYVELHMSYDKVAKEVLLSPATVKRRLEALKDFDRDSYDLYIAERRKRKNGKT